MASAAEQSDLSFSPEITRLTQVGFAFQEELQDASQRRAGALSDLERIPAERKQLEAGFRSELAALERRREEVMGDHHAKEKGLRTSVERWEESERQFREHLESLRVDLSFAAHSRDATRDDQLAFAAYASGSFSREAVWALRDIDDLTRRYGGRTFVALQLGHIAFGRIAERTKGLKIDTFKTAKGVDVVSLPTRHRNALTDRTLAQGFGWLSINYDDPNGYSYTFDDDESLPCDRVVGRPDEDMVAGEADCRFSRFNLSRANLPLINPGWMVASDEGADVLDSRRILSPAESGDSEMNRLVVGDAAEDLLSRIIKSRVGQLQQVDEDLANQAFGHLALNVLPVLGISYSTL